MLTREKQITENLRLVHACCKKFVGKGIEYDDLFQAGSIGLIKAVDGFDSGKGVKLSTYAVPVILGEIKRLFRDGGSIKVSRGLKELSLKANRVKSELHEKLNREPTVGEIAERLSVTVEELTEALCATQPTLSISAGSDGKTVQLDIPTDFQEEKISDALALRQAIGTLCEKDKKIISLRYYKSYTQQKTADTLGMSQVQVSRREKAILSDLKSRLI